MKLLFIRNEHTRDRFLCFYQFLWIKKTKKNKQNKKTNHFNQN